MRWYVGLLQGFGEAAWKMRDTALTALDQEGDYIEAQKMTKIAVHPTQGLFFAAWFPHPAKLASSTVLSLSKQTILWAVEASNDAVARLEELWQEGRRPTNIIPANSSDLSKLRKIE